MNREPQDPKPQPTPLDEFLLYLAAGVSAEEARRLVREEARP